MYDQKSSTRYTETAVLSSSPERLIPLLYDHLLVNLKRGGMFIRNGDIEGKFIALGKAADIVAELIASLDRENGGDLADRLGGLYAFWAKEISVAGRELDPVRIDRVTTMVESLRETWEEAVRLVETGEAEPVGGRA